MATIQGVYLALFGRPADPLGLSFFNSVTNNGQNLAAVGNLASTPEYQARFAGQSNTQVINSIYLSLFNRDADLPGLTFYSAELAAGRLTINNVAIAIYDGALGADVAVRDRKEAAANAFTAAIDTAPEVLGYQGNAAAASGRAFISGVSTAAPTAAQVDAAVVAATSGSQSTLTINLTSTVGEQVTGTAANETINGVISGAGTTNSTLNVGDVINGGSGLDTLNVTYVTQGVETTPTSGLTAGASVSAVEIVNLNVSGVTVGGQVLTTLNSNNFAGVQQLWQIDSVVGGGTAANVTVGSGITAGFRGAGDALNLTVVQAAGAASSIALDGVTSGSAVNFAETTAGTVKSINVSGSVALTGGQGNFQANASATTVDTFNVNLSSNGTVQYTGGGANQLKTVSLAGSTGNLTFDATTSGNALNSITGGSGRDTITFSNAVNNSATATINLGAGGDTLNFSNSSSAAAGATTITLGAGGDSVVFTGGGNLVAVGSVANLTASLTTITDFSAAEDVLNVAGINGFNGRATQNLVNAAVAGAADLAAATTAAAAVANTGNFGLAVFEFGGNTYIFDDNNGGAAVQVGDGLIQLTGVTVASLTGANFVV